MTSSDAGLSDDLPDEKPITPNSTNFVGDFSPLITAPIEKPEEEKLMLSDSSGYESNNIKKHGVSTSKKYDEEKINQIVNRLYYGCPKKKSRPISNRLEQCMLDNDYTRYIRRPQSKSSSLSSSLPNVKNVADNRRSPKLDDFKVWTSGDEMSHHESPNLGENPLNFSLNSRIMSRSDEKLRSHSTKRSTSRSERNDRIETLREKLIFQSDCLRKYLDAKLKQLKIRHELDLRNLEKSSPISTPIVNSKNHRAFAHRRIAKYLSDQKLIPNGHISWGNDVENQEKVVQPTIISPPASANDDAKNFVLSTPMNETSSETIMPQWTIKSYIDGLIEESMNAVIKYQTCEKIANILMKKDHEEKS
uniref:Uncharacterized protein n=1 Tax=Romanomermis culicivorax TaxID=13658 RepID=A0A915KSE7_ROMCU